MWKYAAVAGLSVLTACSAEDPTQTAFYREAGAGVEGGTFGTATINNTMIMSGEKQYTLDLAHRFAREVPSMVNFAFDSAVLDSNARAVLREQAQWIRQFPEVRFRVYGHTDLVGPQTYNKRLGLRRAQAVVGYLSTLGISRARLEALASFGETQPLVVTEGRERRNRRTVTEVSGFVRSHPTVLDGKYAQVIYREYVASAEPPSQLTGMTVGTGEE
ncbi:OmpA family protein [Aquicoccus sp. SCR17]|nr:OmpA family protein [Carideicomes alvinocaridis]